MADSGRFRQRGAQVCVPGALVLGVGGLAVSIAVWPAASAVVGGLAAALVLGTLVLHDRLRQRARDRDRARGYADGLAQAPGAARSTQPVAAVAAHPRRDDERDAA